MQRFEGMSVGICLGSELKDFLIRTFKVSKDQAEKMADEFEDSLKGNEWISTFNGDTYSLNSEI